MPTDRADCPPPEALRHMLADQLPPETARLVERHVGACARCQQSLEELIAKASLVRGAVAEALSLDQQQVLRAVAQAPPRAAEPAGPWLQETLDHEAAGEPVPAPAAVALLEKYDIVGELGRGGMGVVYRARDRNLNRSVALKMILAGPHAGASELARFRAEAEAVARLQHPNVVQVFEVGESEGRPFLALELCPNGSLADKLTGTPLPPREAAALVEVLARAIQAAHEAGVVHRDLKPDNVLFAADGTLKVTDFGLAKRLDQAGQTASGAIMGTPSYMAPEQATGRGREVGPLADVYALGALLYECLTGRPPFKAETALDTIVQVVHHQPVPPRLVNPKVPRDLETICLKCLQKEPRRRYASARDLADDLARWLRGEPIIARPVGAAGRLWRWGLRNPKVAASLGLFGAALVAGTVTSLAFAVQSDRNYSDAVRREGEKLQALEQVTDRERRLEEGLARGLLRPVGLIPDRVVEPETDALGELSRANGRVRELFVEYALESPAQTRQLRNRAEMALHAAVGLDRGRRDRAKDLLLSRLRDGGAGPEQREDCVWIGLALDDRDPELAGASARVLLEGLSRPAESNPLLGSFASATTRLAPRLADGDAAEAVRLAMAALGRPALDAGTRAALGQLIAALAPRLEPGSAEPAAGAAVRRLAQTMQPTALADEQLRALTAGLEALAPRLGPAEAAACVVEILGLIKRCHATVSLRALSRAVALLAPRLDPQGASESLHWVLDRLRERIAPAALIDFDHASPLLWSAAALLPRLAPGERPRLAGEVLGQALDALAQSNQRDAKITLAEVVAALARLGPADGPTAVRRILEEMGRPIGLIEVVRPLAAAVAYLAPALSAEEASELARLGVKLTTQSTRVFPYLAPFLARAVAALAARGGDAEATRQAGTAASLALSGLSATDLRMPYALEVAAEELATLAPSLASPGEAAGRILGLMEKTPDPGALRGLAVALAAVAQRLEPGQATREATAAGRRIVAQGERTPDVSRLPDLARALAALALQLEPAEASRLAAALLRRATVASAETRTNGRVPLEETAKLLGPWLDSAEATETLVALGEAMGRTTNPRALAAQAAALSALAPRLGAAAVTSQAATAARRLREAQQATSDPAVLFSLTHALRSLVPHLDDRECAAVARTTVEALGRTAQPDTIAALTDTLATLVPQRLDEAVLVDLLKAPSCLRGARTVLRRELGRRCDTEFADVWEFADWARRQRPDLDLSTPTTR